MKKKKGSRKPRGPKKHKDSPSGKIPAPRFLSKKILIGGIVLLGLTGGMLFLVLQVQSEKQDFIPGLKPFPAPRKDFPVAQVVFDDFIGSEKCGECHTEQYSQWQNSTHGRAGGAPAPENVIGKFDGEPLRFKDAVVIPLMTEEKEYLFKVRHDNGSEQIIRVDAVVGGGFMWGGGTQSYFSQFPDGSLRMLPFDFIRAENIWFVQLRGNNNWVPIDSSKSLTDLTHWPPFRILGATMSRSNCQNCHGSQIHLQRDSQGKRYNTRFKSLTINCESCHGPGSQHVEIVGSPDYPDREDTGMEALAILNKEEALNICFQCHAVKDILAEDYLPGKELEAHFSLKIPIWGNDPYLPDGRVRAFAYQQNHLFSDCYVSGSMICTDCHDPHSQEYRDIFGQPLQGRFDNNQCLDCHASKAEFPELHSNHPPDSPGNLCTSCHMPFLQHQEVGDQLRFARSDHTIAIPRPKFDASMGIENACKKCHQDKSIDWLEEKIKDWYGELKPHNSLIRGILQSRDLNDRVEASQVLLNDSIRHPIAQIKGLTQFAQRFLAPDMPYLEPQITDRLRQLANSDDIDLQSLALTSLHLCCDQNPDIREFLKAQLKNASERELSLRTRWALAMDFWGSLYSAMGYHNEAITAHRKSVEIKPDDPVTLVNLGRKYLYTGDFQNAAACFRQALKYEPEKASTYFLLAQAHKQQDQFKEALEALNEGLRYNPNDRNALRLLRELESRADQ